MRVVLFTLIQVQVIYENIDKIKGKLQEKLIKDKDSCFLSKTLATIRTDFDIPYELKDFRVNI